MGVLRGCRGSRACPGVYSRALLAGEAGQADPGHAQVVSVNLAWGFGLVPTVSQLTGPHSPHDVSAASSGLKSHQQGRLEPSPSLQLHFGW